MTTRTAKNRRFLNRNLTRYALRVRGTSDRSRRGLSTGIFTPCKPKNKEHSTNTSVGFFLGFSILFFFFVRLCVDAAILNVTSYSTTLCVFVSHQQFHPPLLDFTAGMSTLLPINIRTSIEHVPSFSLQTEELLNFLNLVHAGEKKGKFKFCSRSN